MKRKRSKYMKELDAITKVEAGKSEANRGDVTQISNLIFEKMLLNPEFEIEGKRRALKRLKLFPIG